jgi:chaperonin GroES
MKKPSKLQFRPAKGNVLIRRKTEEEQTKGGLYIPDTAKEKPQEGEIVATHPDNIYHVGDLPLFGKYAGTDIKINDEILILLREEEILGTLVN